MSQSCDAIQLVIIDANCLHEELVSSAIEAVVNAGMRLGAISTSAEVACQVNASPDAAVFDFWLPGDADTYPFGRISSLTDTAPERALFVSTSPDALTQADRAGFRTADPRMSDIGSLLP